MNCFWRPHGSIYRAAWTLLYRNRLLSLPCAGYSGWLDCRFQYGTYLLDPNDYQQHALGSSHVYGETIGIVHSKQDNCSFPDYGNGSTLLLSQSPSLLLHVGIRRMGDTFLGAQLRSLEEEPIAPMRATQYRVQGPSSLRTRIRRILRCDLVSGYDHV